MERIDRLLAPIKNLRHSRADSETSLDVPQSRQSWRRSRTPSPTPSINNHPHLQRPEAFALQPQPGIKSDGVTTDPISQPSGSSLEVPPIGGSNLQSNSSNDSTRPSSPAFVAPSEEEDLGSQCMLSLATVAAELAPIPGINTLVGCLTLVFQAIERSRVNKEQWKLLQGRCVMVTRMAGTQVTNGGGEKYPGLKQATDLLRDTIIYIGERASHWNKMPELLAFVQFDDISGEIKMHFSSLDSCLKLFSYATDVAKMQWAREFDAVQKKELAQLEQLRELTAGVDNKVDFVAQTLDLIAQSQSKTEHTNIQTQDMVARTEHMVTTLTTQVQRIFDQNVAILKSNQMITPVAADRDARRIVQTILTVTGIRLPPELLIGFPCVADATVPIKTGTTCDVYSASFLTDEKVAKKVYRIGMSEKEHVEKYARKFLRDAQLWATFRSDYTLPFRGIGMEAFEGDRNFQLFMVSPLMKNFDAVTYLKKHRKNPNMREGIMRIITDAAKGLQYLHHRDPPVVHSGMRGDNILITDSGGGVLGGFGLTKALQNNTGNDKIPPAVQTGQISSQRWMAPEMVIEDMAVLQTPSDVWGWAMAALELISGLPPYYQHRHAHSVTFDIRTKIRPVRADYAEFEQYALKPDEMWALLERCWEIEPKNRPTIDEVIAELEKMMGKCGIKYD